MRSEIETMKKQLVEEKKANKEQRKIKNTEWKVEREKIKERLSDLEWINEKTER